ncbi:MAG: hypothetical protein PHI13_01410 [Methylococcales bacterium]|nr:hypothetical protein [Methylococcales bacterium]
MAAQNYATDNTYPAFRNSPGNKEISDQLATLTINYSFAVNHPGPYVAASSTDFTRRFARVEVTNMNIATWFARVMSIAFNNVAVSTSAVAGTAPINPCQNTLPIMMCADASPHDKNCNNNTLTAFGNTNNDCYGYELNVVYATKKSSWKATDIGPGNFGYYDAGSGGSAIKDCLAGDPGCTSGLCSLLANPNGQLTSQPGNKVGPGEQGLNTRFNQYKGSVNYPTYLPDSLVSDSLGITLSTTARTVGSEFDPANNYTVPPQANPSAQIYNYFYKDHYQTTNDVTPHDFTQGRRLVTMPMVECSTSGGVNPMPIAGMACFFLTSPSDGNTIYAEFLGGGENCPNAGTTTSTNNFGFYKVQLYKDPFGGSS